VVTADDAALPCDAACVVARVPQPVHLAVMLGWIARGSTNREAAAPLFISEATVKTHLLHVYAKLGVNDRAAAVATAFNRGYLTPRG
jgi:DNA-binding CsgD family transcriptional regulator